MITLCDITAELGLHKCYQVMPIEAISERGLATTDIDCDNSVLID